jgi:hypothetical protein
MLGAALHRAVRPGEAIRRLEEAIRSRDCASPPAVWTFLGMAHHRLGHPDEARRTVDRLREYRPSAEPAGFRDDLETEILHR